MRQYLDISARPLKRDQRSDRTGRDRAIFGEVMRFDLSAGFPAQVTTKRLAFRSVIAELLWFLAGSSDVNELNARGVRIWGRKRSAEYWRPRARFPATPVATRTAVADWIGPDGKHIDQLRQVISTLSEQPASRRMIVTAWNPGEVDATSLPACHALFQFFVAGSRLSLLMYQRSCDLVLGVPFNMAQYAVLLHLVAREVDMEAHEFVHVLADAHVYLDHLDAAREQLEREPFPSPTLWLDPEMRGVDDAVARYRDILARVGRGEPPGPLLDGFAKLQNYQYHPPIKAKMAV